jgi:pimeloyl-ACP methyl ester carboxylesterase
VTLSHHRGGAGEPLVLIHGIGSFFQVWEPVLPALEAEREVIAIDLPGFGASAVLDGGREPHPVALAAAVAAFLDELGLADAHIAGNSLGGWVALELAKLGRARSVCALSPAGFWNRAERTYATLSLRTAARRRGGSATPSSSASTATPGCGRSRSPSSRRTRSRCRPPRASPRRATWRRAPAGTPRSRRWARRTSPARPTCPRR